MNFSLRLSALFVVASVAAGSQAADFLGTFGGRNWYLTTNQLFSFDGARAVASAAGGTLASIRSADETNWLAGTVFPAGASPMYIGYSDALVEGTWVWDDGWAGGYTNWNPGEPNNVGEEDATVAFFGGGPGWNDVPLTYQAQALYTTAVPEPASMIALGAGALALLRKRRSR